MEKTVVGRQPAEETTIMSSKKVTTVYRYKKFQIVKTRNEGTNVKIPNSKIKQSNKSMKVQKVPKTFDGRQAGEETTMVGSSS